ncbi:MAG: carbohydrate kinase [Treponema sp.]|nr:carbohydrate kinase [Treponema sp.]
MIICCGEVLIDMVPTAFPGKASGYLPLPGGSPYNTAIAIGRLGTPVMFLGKFSKDFFGEMLMKRLLDNNVKEDLVIRSEKNSTLAFVKLEKDQNPQYVFYTEGAADRSLSVEDLPKKIPADTHCICFGSIAMTMEPLASAIETLILRENTLQVQGKISPVISYDPNIRPFMIKDKKAFIERMQKWIAASTITKLSAEDFSYIFPSLEPEKALHKILAMGPRMAIVTLGPKGAMALLRRNDGSLTKVVAPIVDLPVKDTIGAGDAFHGAFLSWLERNEKMSRLSLASLTETELYDALYFANKAASIICTRQGAEPPTLKEVENLKLKKPEPKPATPKKAPSKSSTAKPKTVPSHGETEKGTGGRGSHGATEPQMKEKKK